MASDITAVPRWTPATTIDGAEAPNDANWLAILQTHADRQELLWWGELLRTAALPETPLRWVEHVPTGQLMAVGATTAQLYGAGFSANGSPVTHPGTPTLDVPVVGAWSDTLTIVVDDGNSYRTDSSAALQTAVAFSGITAVTDIIYCDGLFVAVGTGGTADTEIETTADGVTWTARSNDNTAPTYTIGRFTGDSGGHVALATDGTSVLCIQWEPGTACKQGWSSDGGLTWTWTVMTAGQQLSHPVYDETRGRWLAVGLEYVGDDLMYNDDPGSGATWTSLGEKPDPAYGPLLVIAGVYFYGDHFSTDGGATWKFLRDDQAQHLVGGRLTSAANYSGLVDYAQLLA